MRLAHTPKVHLEDGDEHVALFRENELTYFVGYVPSTLRVRWTQRAPGSESDPYGWRDARHHSSEWFGCGPMGGELWRALLRNDYRDFLDRQDPKHFAVIVEDEKEQVAA